VASWLCCKPSAALIEAVEIDIFWFSGLKRCPLTPEKYSKRERAAQSGFLGLIALTILLASGGPQAAA